MLLVGYQGRVGGFHPTLQNQPHYFSPVAWLYLCHLEDGGKVHDVPEDHDVSNLPGWAQELMAGPRGRG